MLARVRRAGPAGATLLAAPLSTQQLLLEADFPGPALRDLRPHRGAQRAPPRERVVQDIEIPVERTCDFLEWFLDNVPITPIWLCPLRLRDRDGWPLYPMRPDHTYVNVGFWSSVPGERPRAPPTG